ncbi:DUF3888 domain-containing protein [Bacillus cihuensis]|uniref:DUF3888 domain-containing protein n=1 Tax=Bacillus cihuensis TaxID=1208599 RepID=UPI00040290CF|nr:DUF3888 domain-containing protein [Bacillus cihuensis]
MKKVGVILISLFISVYLNSHLVFAEQNSPEKFPKPYVTTQDVLFTLLLPEMDKIINVNYDKTKQHWNIDRVLNVKYDSEKLKGWYEIDFSIQVFDNLVKDIYHYDYMTIKVGIKNEEGKTDNKIELVNYKKK